MTHKQRCIDYCLQHLQQLSLAFTYSQDTFKHYYKKNNGAKGNAYLVGLHAADMMIKNYSPKNLNDEPRN